MRASLKEPKLCASVLTSNESVAFCSAVNSDDVFFCSSIRSLLERFVPFSWGKSIFVWIHCSFIRQMCGSHRSNLITSNYVTTKVLLVEIVMLTTCSNIEIRLCAMQFHSALSIVLALFTVVAKREPESERYDNINPNITNSITTPTIIWNTISSEQSSGITL